MSGLAPSYTLLHPPQRPHPCCPPLPRPTRCSHPPLLDTARTRAIPPPSLMTQVLEDIVIIGAGIAGLATALGLHRYDSKAFLLLVRVVGSLTAFVFASLTWRHVLNFSCMPCRRLGLRSLVLESSDQLRATGFALATWSNAWRALDALGAADSLRARHIQLQEVVIASAASGEITSQMKLKAQATRSGEEPGLRCVRRNLLLEALASDLPEDTIRFGSKVVLIEEQGHLKLLHLADGSTLKAKVPSPIPFPQKELEKDPVKMKRYILNKLQKAPKGVVEAVERTEPSAIISSPLRLRWPFELLWGGVCRGNVCLAGDALHAMTPDLGQGGCSALEDGVTLARCLGEVFLGRRGGGAEEEHESIKEGLEKYARQRKWRSFELICTAYVLGRIQQSDGAVMNFLRDRVFKGQSKVRLLPLGRLRSRKTKNPSLHP
ncbi:hypothetical protein Taro_049981 [Colocasia esculenta]|uniref:FAD-binding domain-containing protein n=1 Tax=Colocasia esculenta TaxID=4460 RepID=A0A843XCS0_COLES|nr:hypothetical protein [Colocasia esculenta]